MNEFLIYILKVSAATALLTLPYYLVLRNDANLVIKRLYLAGSILLSWIFPLLTIQKPGLVSSANPVFIIDPATAAASTEASLHLPQSGGISFISLIGYLYLTGIAVFLMLNVYALFRLRKQTTGSSGRRYIIWPAGLMSSAIASVQHTKNEKVFTVFRNIYLPEKYSGTADTDSIMIHERAHIRQLHAADLLISEINLALTWFNPFSWLISRMIKENHEHLADREVLARGVNPAHYKALLLNHAMGGEVFRLGHQFNHSLTKKRFNMMKKMKAPKSGILKYMLFVPVILAFTLMATASGLKERTITGKVYLETRGEPAIGAAVIVAGTSKGTVVDRKGEFSLEVSGNPQLVISFVGYETLWVKASEAERKALILVPTAYEIPLDAPTRKMNEEHSVEVRVKKDGEKQEFIIKSDGDKMNLNDDSGVVYVVDGEVSKSIEDIDADKIEKIEVYKGGDNEMVKKYNARSGVIMITTKAHADDNDAEHEIIKVVEKVNDSGETTEVKEIKVVKKKMKKEEIIIEEDEDVTVTGDEETFFIVEEVPSFPGGLDALGTYINENLEYPASASRKKIAGKVMVEMTVQFDGSLSDIRVSQSSNDIFNEAAMAVFADMPAWNPGKQRGKPVRCKVIVPVRFNPAQE